MVSKRILSLCFLFFVSGACSSYNATTEKAHAEFYSGEYAEAAAKLEAGAHEEGKNQLLYLLDRAMALHHAGNYEESNKDFHLADKLAEINDYTSLTQETATYVTNDKIVQYKAEEFEYVLISQYLALNYLLLHKYEDALVECRRVNHKLQMLISQAKRKYQLNPMAFYLSAMIYEDQQEWDDAYVDYKNTYKLRPEMQFLRADLYRLAWKTRNFQEMEKWQQRFQLSGDQIQKIKKNAERDEIVLLIESGRAPVKKPANPGSAIPQFFPSGQTLGALNVTLNGKVLEQPHELYNVESVAIENLQQKYAAIMAKQVVKAVGGFVIADQVGKKTDPLLGLAVWLGLRAANQADLRSWVTLPREFQVLRIRVDRQRAYKIRVSAEGAAHADEKLVHFDQKNSVMRQFVPIKIL